MSTTPALPCGIVQPGALIHELSEGPPAVGDDVVIYSRGRFRLAVVVKVTPTRVQVDYAAPSAPSRSSARPWFKRADVIDAPSPHPTNIILDIGPAPRSDMARTWKVKAPSGGRTGMARAGSRRGGHDAELVT